MEAAMRCFHDHGYTASTVTDIVEAAGYTRGAFYFHFVDKGDCFRHVIAYRERLRGDWPASILDGLDPQTTSLEDVLEKMFAHFAATDHGSSAWVLVMVDHFQQHRDDPEAAQLFAEVYRHWHAQIARFVRGLQEQGWLDPDRDPDRLARQAFAYVEGTTVHRRLYQPDHNDLVDGLTTLLRS
ncbi:MAG TPA: TetR/AcrR family transcriptional regulator [Gaiellaceae bacterium]|nr:TetR/AcrR family transcriptional regulator [Gaiellaceae bacterium]